MSISWSSALGTRFQALISSAWPTSEHTLAVHRCDHPLAPLLETVCVCGHGGTRNTITCRRLQTCPEVVCQVFCTFVLLSRRVVQGWQSMTIPDVATQQDRPTHHRLLWFANTETRCVSI